MLAGISSAQEPLALEEKPEAIESEVRLAGMTYVSSRGELNDMVLDAQTARILPEREVAHLEGVRVRLVSATGRRRGARHDLRHGSLRVRYG